MRLTNLVYLLGLSVLATFYSCSTEKKSPEGSETPVLPPLTNNDLGQARELRLSSPVSDTTWLIDSSNVGAGQVQDFNPDSAFVRNLFTSEENTDWYRFTAPADTFLSVTLEPNDPASEYDLVLFRSTGDSIASDLKKGVVPAIRANFARRSRPEDTLTGFYCAPRLADFVPADSSSQLSGGFPVTAGETYFLVANTPAAPGKGYKLRILACAPGSGGGSGKPVSSGEVSGASGNKAEAGPEITRFYPSSGRKGSRITITGRHLADATAVRFGGTEATSFRVESDEKILAYVGEGSTGVVEVACAGGVATRDGFKWYKKRKKSSSSGRGKSQVEDEEDEGDGAVSSDGEFYIVKPKDTMFSIAFVFGMTVEEILKLNKLDNTNVFPGQKLKVIKRQLPQKAIEKKVSASKPVKPSPPVPGSTTYKKPDPARPDAVKPVEPVPAKPVEPVVARNPAFNPTPNFPKDNPVVKTGLVQNNSLEPADKNFWVYCNVTSGVNKNPVRGTLQVVDLKKKDLVYNVESNRSQAVPLYNAGGKQKLIICDIFGYKKQDFDLNLDNIINDSTAQQVQIIDDTIVINFELRRLEKGDIAVAYNIFFYDDASVMLPKSTYELGQLLELMEENKKIKIKIHGHTNTSNLGKILYMERGDPNFFRLTDKNKATYGPARLLSKKRAETIKWYLESKRIKDERIETEGHGGSQMLYPKTHPLAYKNKRVEVEILEDK